MVTIQQAPPRDLGRCVRENNRGWRFHALCCETRFYLHVFYARAKPYFPTIKKARSHERAWSGLSDPSLARYSVFAPTVSVFSTFSLAAGSARVSVVASAS